MLMERKVPMNRAVVNVSTTPYFARGQQRLAKALDQHGHCDFLYLTKLPAESPTHEAVPFAFKYHALYPWRDKMDALIWADCSILPVRSLEPLWQHIEAHGAMVMNCGWSNYEWTADSAYPDLFPEEPWGGERIDAARILNRTIKHVVGGFFGLSMKHPVGRAILDEMYRLAQTKAFCGPTINANSSTANEAQQFRDTPYCGPCGPSDVRGHRHDQTALSVVAWRNGVQLVDPPQFLVYGKPEVATDERTVCVADGSYA